MPPPEGSAPPVDPPADAPLVVDRSTPIAARLRRRRSSLARWIVPLFFVSLLAGICVWLLLRDQPRLEGHLPAEVLHGFSIPPQPVPGELLRGDAETRQALLAALAGEPERVVSPGVLALEFRAGEDALLVALEPLKPSQLVRVRTGGDPHLTAFRRGHGQELAAPRRNEISAAARDFLREWQQAQGAGMPFAASAYLTRLGLPALAGGLGYHVRAVAGRKIYPCVYEDVDGGLYFILPAGTSSFRLEGRPLADKRLLFPGSYAVRISAAPEPR